MNASDWVYVISDGFINAVITVNNITPTCVDNITIFDKISL